MERLLWDCVAGLFGWGEVIEGDRVVVAYMGGSAVGVRGFCEDIDGNEPGEYFEVARVPFSKKGCRKRIVGCNAVNSVVRVQRIEG